MEKILALSWKEPFGSLMLHGKIETRIWKTNYRGLVLICCSKKIYSPNEVLNICGERQYTRYEKFLEKNLNYNMLDRPGKAIAIGRLVDCRPMRKEDEDKCFVKYYSDLYCHIYEDVKEINPFFWKGSQGWKTVTEEQKQLIKIL